MTQTAAPAPTIAQALEFAGRQATLTDEVYRTLRGARVMLDRELVTIAGVCSCGCDAQLQLVEQYGVWADLDRFIVQTDDQRVQEMAYTCVPASRLRAV